MIAKTKILPRYAETDQMGIIHHSVYAIWYEQARTDFFNQVGIRYDEIEKQGLSDYFVYDADEETENENVVKVVDFINMPF